MKKALLLFVSVLAISCSSSSDDSKTTEVDAIVGVWKIVSKMEQKGTGPIVPQSLSGCQLEQAMNLNSFGNAAQYYYEQDLSGGCALVSTVNGDWGKVSGTTNQYRFTNLSNGEFDFTATVTFSNNNRTMQFATADGPYTIYSTYTKL